MFVHVKPSACLGLWGAVLC